MSGLMKFVMISLDAFRIFCFWIICLFVILKGYNSGGHIRDLCSAIWIMLQHKNNFVSFFFFLLVVLLLLLFLYSDILA